MKVEMPFFGDEVKRPIAVVNLINPHNGLEQKFRCILDTGADCSLFNSDITESLGHDLMSINASQEVMSGISGKGLVMYIHTFIVQLLHPKYKTVLWESEEVKIKCNPANNVVPLLGSRDFLSNFVLTFDYANEITTIHNL